MGFGDTSLFIYNSMSFELIYTANYEGNSLIGGNDLAIIAMAVVPEPSTWVALICGLGTLVMCRGFVRRAS